MNTLNTILGCIILLLFCLILLIYYAYTTIYYYEDSEYYKYKYTYLEDIINELDTGDLILFSSYYFSAIRVLSHPRFSHIGMIIRKDNKIYGIELLDSDYTAPGKMIYNINIFDLKERIIYYPGFIYISKYNKKLDAITKTKLIKETENKIYEYPINNVLLLKYLLNINNNQYNKSCIEYIVHLLEICNIHNFRNIKINNYMHEILLFCNGNKYTNPIRVIIKDKKIIIDNYNRKNLC
jgi:hypothetical protein